MPQAAEDFDVHCRQAAMDFLQTVVVADNQPILTTGYQAPKRATRRTAQPPGSIDEDDMPGSAIASNDARNDPEPGDSHNLDLRQIVNTFAQQGITCGSYLPREETPDDDVVKYTFNCAFPADIAIIDWQLKENNPEPAIEVISRLLEADEAEGGRLRLIIVYTGERDLGYAAGRLASTLKRNGHVIPQDANHPEILEEGSVRIRFLNKPMRGYEGASDIVNPEDLPDRAINEFVALSRGLLRAFALASVSAIRRDVHRMLAQFPPQLDGAFAGQRATIDDPDDAGRLMIEVLQSEFAVTLNKADLATEMLGAAASNKWLALQDNLPEPDVDLKFKEDPDREKLKKLDSSRKHELVEKGLGGASDNTEKRLKIISAFLGCDDDAVNRRRQFAILSTLAWHGGTDANRSLRQPPALSLGSVIKQPSDDVEAPTVLWLCLQPKCDCVRLHMRTEPRGFTLVMLKENNERFDLIIPVGERNKAFRMDHKEPVIRTVPFEVATGHTMVVAREKEDGWSFTDYEGYEWEWVAEVRESRMLELVNRLAAQLTRIGLNQDEWVRLQSRPAG
ncbi:response regulator receiver domain [Spectribacter hydrogenooxidans]|uniref:Response regulator receiver domain n=1 Tax=Spectribacter hydrogenoxidans TaxID=3075608 RepID=A0ABU3BWG8_9GAMM|nr:response regulator receiver domain [Salinisphaera sp. W335]MDT0633639.1 response regulator receiver domain [Salinisphaera sp. W335]